MNESVELKELKEWIKDKYGAEPIDYTANLPDNSTEKFRYVLTSIPIKELEFPTNDYNPRKPDQGKVNELAASIKRLSMLTPLVCAYIETNPEKVVLIDGQHRYLALTQIGKERGNSNWYQSLNIDLKIFYGLSSSQLHILSTYLNRTRRNLRKGEYYKAIVKIYFDAKEEYAQEKGKEGTEVEIFDRVGKDLIDRNFDLSIGRIVGLTAFSEEEEGSWYPYVGIKQGEKLEQSKTAPPKYEPLTAGNYKPLTAGNLAQFLKNLCYPSPYEDDGTKRDIEINNVLKLGTYFTKYIFEPFPIKKTTDVVVSSVASKYWCMLALGSIAKKQLNVGEKEKGTQHSIMSNADVDWKQWEKFISIYGEIMKEEADRVKKAKDTNNIEDIRAAWSFQTIQNRVENAMFDEFKQKGVF